MFNCVCVEAEKSKEAKANLSHIKVYLEKLSLMCYKTYFPHHTYTQEDERFLYSPVNNNKVRGKHSCVCVCVYIFLPHNSAAWEQLLRLHAMSRHAGRGVLSQTEEWHLKVTFLWAQQKTITGTSVCVCTQV